MTIQPRIHVKSIADCEPLLGKRVLLKFTEDRCIVGRLGRNSFLNETLCITTGEGDETLYGNFFF